MARKLVHSFDKFAEKLEVLYLNKMFFTQVLPRVLHNFLPFDEEISYCLFAEYYELFKKCF